MANFEEIEWERRTLGLGEAESLKERKKKMWLGPTRRKST